MVPQPATKQHMMTLIGMAGYCRAWLPDYVEVTQPLFDHIHGHKMVMNDEIKWTAYHSEGYRCNLSKMLSVARQVDSCYVRLGET